MPVSFDQGKVDQIATEFLDSTVRDIIQGILDSGQNASGETIDGLGLEKISDNEWVLFGRKFLQTIETGRGPSSGGGSSGQSLKDRIYDWLPFADKYGITYSSDGERISLAFAISKKIHKEGTNLHIENKNTKILTTALSSENLSKFVSRLLLYYGGVITKRLKDGYNG